jgi:hypothetical protein
MERDRTAVTPRLAVGAEGGAIEYRDGNDKIIWAIPVQAVAIVAKHTNPHGPWVDDYFIVFVFIEQGLSPVAPRAHFH